MKPMSVVKVEIKAKVTIEGILTLFNEMQKEKDLLDL